MHARGPVAELIDTVIVTDGDVGYGIEPQSNGNFGSIRRLNITTVGSVSHGIGAWVNDGAHIGELLDTVITTAGSNAHGIILGDDSSIQRMERVTIRRSSSAFTDARAIVVENDGAPNYFRTNNIVDNTVCTMAGGVPWAALLADDDVAYTLPTVELLNSTDGPFGAQTFPWGDANHAADNPGFNLQTQWGGACP